MPEPGDWAVVSTGGAGGKLISLGEWAAGDGFGPWDHAFVYLGGGKILQAEPKGSEVANLGTYGHIKWSCPRYRLSDEQRALVPAIASSLTGIPYSSLDYLALAGHHLHVPDLPLWPRSYNSGWPTVTLKEFIQSGNHMICSQLVDEFMLRLGVHLFADGRWPGYVMPADLARLLP